MNFSDISKGLRTNI